MVERTPVFDLLAQLLLIGGVALLCAPVYLAFVAASHDAATINSVPMPVLPGGELAGNLATAWTRGDLGRQLVNSAVMALGIAAGKVALSIISAFALVYFRFPFRMTAFWLIFASLMLPVEIRIVPTYAVMSNVLSPVRDLASLFGIDIRVRWSMLNSYAGLILPLIASATATFLFRQFFLTVPDELAEAAQVDGAKPLRFFIDVLLPLSRTNIAALMVVMFVYGWNQYLWPLLVTTKPEMNTIVMGITKLMPSMDARPEWNLVMAAALLALLPPTLVVVLLQRWFVKGLIDSDR